MGVLKQGTGDYASGFVPGALAAVATSPDKKLRVAVASDLELGDHARAVFRG